jgi:outer membrane protein insertion porin family
LRVRPKSAPKTCQNRGGAGRLFLAAGLLWGLLWGVGGLFAAVAPPTVEKIEIRHLGPPAVSDDLIRANIGIKVGDPYSPGATDQDILTLMATGYFANVRVEVERGQQGLKLIYKVEGKLVLTEIRFEGNKKYSNRKLLKKVAAKIGEPIDDYKLFSSAQEMQKMYQKAGYQRTRVEARVTPNETQGRASVTFDVKETPKIRVVDVLFDGARAFKQSKLRMTIKTRRHWMFSWLTGSGKLKDDQLAEDKQKLIEFYQDAGYIDFDIKEVRPEELSPTRMVIRFIVSEGRQYKVGKVEFNGNSTFSSERIRSGIVVMGRLIRPTMLETATFTPKGLEKDREAIENFYGAYGYIGKEEADRIRVIPIKQPNVEQGTMDLVYHIEEGEKSYIEKIEIRGNTKTRDRVIRRELAVAPGEVFNMVRVKVSQERLKGLQFLSKSDTEVEPTEDMPNAKNLVVNVEEGPSGNFYFGAGFSTIESLFGYVGMTQGNFDLFNPPSFTGGGQKLRLQATVGTQQENYELRFVEPWFLGQRLILDVDLYHMNLGYLSDVYTEKRTGARFGLTKAIWRENLRAGVSYTIEDIGIDFGSSSTSTNYVVSEDGDGHGRTYVVSPPAISTEMAQEQGDWLVSKVGLSLAYDTRGGGMLPNRGQMTELTTYVAGGPLGGEVDFYKLELESAWYFKGFAKGHVIEFVGRVGVLAPYGNSDMTHIWDRFYLGGAYTLRGYKFRDVGPKDSLGEPLGGNTYWMGSLEYSLPVIDRLRVAAFYDIGTVNADAWDFGAQHYADNWGIGLRLNIPQMGPLRLDYGFPITHDDTVSGKPHFQFSVGWNRRY